MRYPLCWLLSCLFSLFCLSPVWSADLKTTSDAYQKSAEGIRQRYKPQFDDLQQQYQKALETLKTRAKGQGDFKTTKAALAEIERFQKAKCLPPAPEEGEIPEIKAFQATYVKQYSRLEADLTANLGALTVKYQQDLDRLLKELTKAEKMDEAVAVDAELAKAQAAVKDFSEQLAALKGSVTNATVAAIARTPAPVAPAVPGKAAVNPAHLYLVIDLSRGPKAKEYPMTSLADAPKKGWTDEYKTDKLVLRKIEPGTFVMGSPEGELGRQGNETPHEVTLTQPFYIGVFEVTQKQWERVMGDWPSNFSDPKSRETRPVENVSYNDLRGEGDGANWPATNSVDASSFMGRLRARTGQAFDLPTETQWEYACRAGTATALNSGKNLTSKETCPDLAAVARYKGNAGDAGETRRGTAKAGSYPPNAWGLYDLHGNVWEWCLDWRGNYPEIENDPKGVVSGSNRVTRGGGWDSSAEHCRSANRDGGTPPCERYSVLGFRIARTLP